MIKYLLHIILVAVVAVGFVSCSDILDEPPQRAVDKDIVIESVSDAQAVLNGAYAAMRDYWTSSATGGIVLGDVMTDETFASKGYTTHKTMQAYTFSSATEEIASMWQLLYMAIGNTIAIENKIDVVPGDAATRQSVKGQALAIRATAYMELSKWFAKPYLVDSLSPGVPIKRTTDVTEKPQRAKVNEVFAYMEADLNKAATLLKNSTAVNDDAIRYVSYWAVKSLQARFYLYKGKYQEAVNAATVVINSGKFSLCDSPESIADMWANDSGKELIFMLGYTTGNLGGLLANDYYKLEFDASNTSTRTILPNATFSYVPSLNFLDLYSQYGSSNAGKTAANDYRMQDSVYFVPSASGSTLKLCYKYPGNPRFLTESGLLNINMPKLIRLPEIYLIRAEAYAQLNDDANARKDYNYLRSKRISSYVSESSLSGTTLKMEIFNERCRELCFEGLYWYDLKRNQMGFTRSPQAQEDAYLDATAKNLTVTATNNRWLLPIPQAERNGNPDITPNPGY